MAAKVKQTTNVASQQTTFLAQWGQSLAVFAFALLLYIGSIGNGYNLDDELVTRNHRLTSKGIEAIPAIFSSFYYEDEMNYKYEYRPVVLASFALEHSLFGESPKIGHVINLLLYALTCVLLLHLLQQLFKSYSPWAALAATLLFVAHPLHTEVVCSLKNRDELLALLFSMLSLRAALHFVSNRQWWQLLFSVVLFCLAYMSKQSALIFLVITPFVVLLTTHRLRESLVMFFGLFFPIFAIMALTIKLPPSSYVLFLMWPLFMYAVHRYITLPHLENNHYSFAEKFKAWLSKNYHINPINKTQKGFWLHLFLSVLVVIVAVALMNNQLRECYIYILLAFFFLNSGVHQYFICAFALIVGYHFFSESNPPQPLLLNLFVFWGVFTLEQGNVKILPRVLVLLGIGVVIFLPGIYYFGLGITHMKISLVFMFLVGYLVVAESSTKLRWINTAILICSMIVTIGLIIMTPELYLFIALLQMGTLLLTTNVMIVGRISYRISLITLLMLSLATTIVKYNQAEVIPSKSAKTEVVSTPKIATALVSNPDRELSFIEYPLGVHTTGSKKIGTTAGVMWHHLSKIIVPYPLSFYYGFNEVPIIEAREPLAVFSILLHLALFCLAVFLIKRYYLVSLGLITYLVGAALYSNYFIPIPGMVADRFMYIPSLGWSIVLICGLAHLFKLNNIHDGNARPTNKGFLIVVLTVLLCYSYMSYARSFDWKNHLTLMRKDLNHVPNSAQAHNLLALNIMKFSTETPMPPAEQFVMWQEATTHFKRSLEIYPKTFNVAFDLGRVYGMLNKTDSAIYYYKKAIFLDSTYIQLYLNMGELLFGKGDLRGAIPYYQKYMELTSNSYEGYGKLSFVYFQLKEFDQSIAINKLAIQQLPFVADPYTNIGRVYLSLNKKQEALFWLEKADSIMQGRDVEVRKMLKK